MPCPPRSEKLEVDLRQRVRPDKPTSVPAEPDIGVPQERQTFDDKLQKSRAPSS